MLQTMLPKNNPAPTFRADTSAKPDTHKDSPLWLRDLVARIYTLPSTCPTHMRAEDSAHKN